MPESKVISLSKRAEDEEKPFFEQLLQEGARKGFAPRLTAFVLPITLVILLVLFAVQRFGTGPLGALFGGIMLFWFITLGIAGLAHILQAPEVLAALDPMHALRAVSRMATRNARPLMVWIQFLSFTWPLIATNLLEAPLGHWGSHNQLHRITLCGE